MSTPSLRAAMEELGLSESGCGGLDSAGKLLDAVSRFRREAVVLRPDVLDALARVWVLTEDASPRVPAKRRRAGDDEMPLQLSWSAYREYCQALRPLLSDPARSPVFVLRRDNQGGAVSFAPWFCKSHLYTFLLLRQWKVVPREAALFLLPSHFSETALVGFSQVIGPTATLVHLLDGIFTGVEAHNLRSWLFPVKWKCGAKIQIVAPLCFKGQQMLSGDEVSVLSEGRDDGVFVVGRLSPLFVLPFKISDSASLGVWSRRWKDANPGFAPPYKQCLSYKEDLVETEADLQGDGFVEDTLSCRGLSGEAYPEGSAVRALFEESSVPFPLRLT